MRGLAEYVCAGVREVEGAEALDRTVDDAVPEDLLRCNALVLGSPNWSGVTGRLKSWLDESGDLWESGDLAGKPGAAFAAGWSMHGGLEATLLQLIHLLVGHGMIFVGLPWTERMRRSGSYYGTTAPRGTVRQRPGAGAGPGAARGASRRAPAGLRPLG